MGQTANNLMLRHIQEHDLLSEERSDAFDRLSLVDFTEGNRGWGYYASYYIGAEWIDDDTALVVTPKRGMEHIDFLSMFAACIASGVESERFASIYNVSTSCRPIDSPALASVLSPLLIFHFIATVRQIKHLKKEYVSRCENLRKVKGRIAALQNERKNIMQQRFDRVFCTYSLYTPDTPENRLIKRALLFSRRYLCSLSATNKGVRSASEMILRALQTFEGVSSDISISQVHAVKANVLFRSHAEAVRLAKIILHNFDYSISNADASESRVMPFRLDMSLLYEIYVLGLLRKAYPGCITYQATGDTGKPDFLFCSGDFKAILDTKYIPRYDTDALDTDVIRQLSGYSRDMRILRRFYPNISASTPLPPVPCVIIYPVEQSVKAPNPFLSAPLSALLTPIPNLLNFHKISIPVPLL